MAKTTKTALAGVNELFLTAWGLTKERFWPVLWLWLIQGAIVVGLFIVAFLALMGSSLTQLVSNPALLNSDQFGEVMLNSLMGSVASGFLIVVAMLLFLMVVMPFLQAANIALVGSVKKLSLKEALSLGWQRFIPTLLVGFLTSFYVFGGFGLLLIPGVVMAILFSFVIYEVVLENATPLNALKTSAGMVKAHFWAVVGRILVIMALAMGVAYLSQGFANSGEPLLSLVDTALNLFFSIFSTMYSVALYRSLKKVAGKATLNLTWLTVFSAIGWLGVIGFAIFWWNILSTLMNSSQYSY